MPKIINQANSALDSLNAKLHVLEIQFTALAKKQSVLQDSVQSLNQTILKADIATSFYDTHLATYTGIFAIIVGIILGIATLINWYSLIKPQEQKFNNLVQELQQNLNNFKEEHIDEIIDNLNSTTIRAFQSIIHSHEGINEYTSFLFSIRMLKVVHDWENVKVNVFPDYLEFAIGYLENADISEGSIDDLYQEMIDILNYLSLNCLLEHQESINFITQKYSAMVFEYKTNQNAQIELDI